MQPRMHLKIDLAASRGGEMAHVNFIDLNLLAWPIWKRHNLLFINLVECKSTFISQRTVAKSWSVRALRVFCLFPHFIFIEMSVDWICITHVAWRECNEKRNDSCWNGHSWIESQLERNWKKTHTRAEKRRTLVAQLIQVPSAPFFSWASVSIRECANS